MPKKKVKRLLICPISVNEGESMIDIGSNNFLFLNDAACTQI